MPNWCSNSVVIETNNLELIRKITDLFSKDDQKNTSKKYLFDALVPLKEDEEADTFWGTKWDVNTSEIAFYVSETFDSEIGMTLQNFSMSFDTAWSPPIEFLKKLVRMYGDDVFQIIKVYCFFYETGNDFCGEFKSYLTEISGILGEPMYSSSEHYSWDEYQISKLNLEDEDIMEKFIDGMGMTIDEWMEYYGDNDGTDE